MPSLGYKEIKLWNFVLVKNLNIEDRYFNSFLNNVNMVMTFLNLPPLTTHIQTWKLSIEHTHIHVSWTLLHINITISPTLKFYMSVHIPMQYSALVSDCLTLCNAFKIHCNIPNKYLPSLDQTGHLPCAHQYLMFFSLTLKCY